MLRFLQNLHYVLHEGFCAVEAHIRWKFRDRSRETSKQERDEKFAVLKARRKDILRRSQDDLWAGSKTGATDIQRRFFHHLEAEAARLKCVGAGSAVMLQSSTAGLDSHICGWAAHFLSVEEFETFFLETVAMNKLYARQAVIEAWRSVADFRTFPRLEATQKHHLL